LRLTCSAAAEATLACTDVSSALAAICWLTAINSLAAPANVCAVLPSDSSTERNAVTSVAYLTTLNGLPARSRIGKYEPSIQTDLPRLVMRRKRPVGGLPAPRSAQNCSYSWPAA